MKKILCAVLVLCVLLSLAVPAAAAASEIVDQKTDGSITMTLYSDGLLKAEGTGVLTHELSSKFNKYVFQVKRIEVGSGITEIGNNGFRGFSEAEELLLGPDLVKIGTAGFAGLRSVKEVTIPDSVKEIGAYAFSECHEMTKLKLSSNLEIIGSGAFMYCEKLTAVDLPNGLKYLGGESFCGGTKIEHVTIPDSVVDIAYDSLGEGPLNPAFSSCNLKSIDLPAGLKVIPYGFSGCLDENGLDSFEIPETVTTISNYAFSGCHKLRMITIPKNVTSIGAMAFVNTFSLTSVVFMGDAPAMDSPFYCASFNGVMFYPKDNPTWSNIGHILWQSGGLQAAVPYTVDGSGNIVPVAPDASAVKGAIQSFSQFVYPAGTYYPDNYSYIINGNMLTGYDSEAFAFELSDACFGFLPISEKRPVSYDALKLGDILYSGGVWVITDLDESGVKVAGVGGDNLVYYDLPMTRAQVQAAAAYRTRYGVSPYAGEFDPALSYPKIEGPDRILMEAEVYRTIMALQNQFPEGMPYSEKNHYHGNVTWELDEGVTASQDGHGCSAFAGILSDTAFGDLPARYYEVGYVDYNNIMIGDRLFTANHEVVVIGVYTDCVVVAEGNYNQRIHWGRVIPREEIVRDYALVTRYPEGTIVPPRTGSGCATTGHVPVVDPGYVAGCITPGLSEGSHCAICGAVITAQTAVPAHGIHTWNAGACIHCGTVMPPISELLADLTGKDVSAEEIRSALQSMDTAELKSTMENNSSAIKSMETLEEAAGGAAQVVTQTGGESIPADQVDIVGANLNELSSGAKAVLVIAAPENTNAVPEQFEPDTAVHFSMTLDNVENTGNLKVPVSITLPIPAHLNPYQISLIHYHNGKTEVLTPDITQENGKFFANVVLSGFSDFAMAQRANAAIEPGRPSVNMFRMYDPNSGEHFYTGSEEERENLVSVGWNYEGVGFTFPLTTGDPVHRLYDPVTGEHLYTMSNEEKDALLAAGWNYEGIAFNSGFDTEVPQFRLHNPNATRGAYHFTASIEERDFLISLGWEYQGIGWYSCWNG